MKLHVLHPNDRALLVWMREFHYDHGRQATAAEVAQHRGWHRSSAVNWAHRMQQDGWLDNQWNVLGEL